MQLQIDHYHETEVEHAEVVHKRRSLSHHFDSQKAIKEYFQASLAHSEQRLNEDTTCTLTKLRETRERRVYSSLDVSPLEYLFILFQDRREHLGKEVQTMEQLMNKKHKRVVSDLLKEHINIERKSKSISEIKKELEESLQQMKVQSPSLTSGSKDDPEFIRSRKQDIYHEFMQKGYWKVSNEKNEEVKDFLKSLRQNKLKQKRKYRERIREQRRQQQQQANKKKIEKEEESLRLKEELHHSFQKKKETKDEDERVNQQKREEVQFFLKKFKEKPPNYIIFSQRYKQKESLQEKQKKQFLALLKQSKRHSSLGEMKQDYQKYQEMKSFHQLEKKQQRKIEERKKQEIKERLENMYKSRSYSKGLDDPIDPKKKREQQVIKKQMYSQEVATKYTPKVDEEKRLELLKNIEELNKKEDHKIRKYLKGQEIVLDRQELDPRKVGLQYLEEVKKITSSIERKPPPTPEVKQKKLVDRSLLKNTFYNRKVTISNWKEIMDNKSLSPSEKEEKIKLYFKMIEEKRLQSLSQGKKADQERSLSLQKMMDHYEVEKAEAKLALLKSLK